MKKIYALLALTLMVGGCTIKATVDPLPAPPIPLDKMAAAKKKRPAKPTFSPTLGGIIASDRWVVYPEKSEEEFEGNVHYDNGIYIFQADYALSQRVKNQITARQVYIRKNEPDGSWAALYAQKARYNYQTGQGEAETGTKTPLHVIYQTAQGEIFHAWGKKLVFNTKEQNFQLTGKAKLTRQDLQGKITTLTADSISARQPGPYALLQGKAYITDGQYQLQADTLEYDGTLRKAYAYGDRPLAQGTTESGTFAIIADKVTVQTDSRRLQLEGSVQGWVVSEQLNQATQGKK